MLENVGRKVALIVILLIVSIGLMVVPPFLDPPRAPFQLGLDLQGGTRIVYRFDFAAARAEGKISPNENTKEILGQAVTILRGRVDPTGTHEISVHTEGDDRVVIELPGNAALEGTTEASSTLGQALQETSPPDGTVVLADGSAFSNSGEVQIGDETIRYGGRAGNSLTGITRSKNGKRQAHAAGDPVTLVNAD